MDYQKYAIAVLRHLVGRQQEPRTTTKDAGEHDIGRANEHDVNGEYSKCTRGSTKRGAVAEREYAPWLTLSVNDDCSCIIVTNNLEKTRIHHDTCTSITCRILNYTICRVVDLNMIREFCYESSHVAQPNPASPLLGCRFHDRIVMVLLNLES